jgi:hypothetical protein
VRSKVTRLDPLGIKRVMDVSGPSAIKKAHTSVKTKTNKDKLIGKSTILTKEPKHTLRSRLRVESDISSSENSESELTFVWVVEWSVSPPITSDHQNGEGGYSHIDTFHHSGKLSNTVDHHFKYEFLMYTWQLNILVIFIQFHVEQSFYIIGADYMTSNAKF